MATLPDLNPDDPSFLAYWNIYNHGGLDGGDNFDAAETMSAGLIDEATVYDNGYIAEITLTNGRSATARVKQDGWFVVYINRDADYAQNTTSTLRGPWDMAYRSETSADANFSNHALARAINSLQSQFDGDQEYSSGDVGLYNYQFPDAEYVSGFSHRNSSGSTSRNYIYTDSTTVYQQYAWCITTAASTNNNRNVEFDGMMIINQSTSSNRNGYIDVTDEDLADSPNEEVGFQVLTQQSNSTVGMKALVLWAPSD